MAKEMDQLKQDKAKLNERVSELEALNEELDKKQKVQTIANSLESPEERTSAKLKINELVREIDRCVALINK